MVFNDAAIGATHGGTTFTNWPDEYIHSSADDLWQMDRTTLKRNALAVSALAWYMANVKSGDAQRIAPAIAHRAFSRITLASQRASESLNTPGGAIRSGEVAEVIRHAVQKEIAALGSLRSVAGDHGPSLFMIEAAQSSIKKFEPLVRDGLMDVAVTDSMDARDLRVPTRNPNLGQYFHQVDDIKKVKGLSPLMAYEALNFADGKRSMWEIYLATRAESLGEGEWYYGKVTPEMIQEYFNNAASVGAVTLAERKPEATKPAKKKK